MSDENESYFMMIFKFIFKIIIYPFILLYKLLSLNWKVTGVVVVVGVIVGIIIYISNSSGSEETTESDSEETTESDSEETTESGVETPPLIPPQNATCSSISTDGCPDGYLYKTVSNDIECVGTTCDVDIDGADLETCCDQIIPPPEAQTSRPQDTELPICSEVAEPDKLPSSTIAGTWTNSLQECSETCNIMSTCQSFGYSETERGNINCFLGSSITTRDPEGSDVRYNYSWSFYPKCQIIIPNCDSIIIRNKLPTIHQYRTINNTPTINNIPEECINTCFTQDDNCNSFSYNKDESTCYLYENENIASIYPSTLYDYYPVKCQP